MRFCVEKVRPFTLKLTTFLSLVSEQIATHHVVIGDPRTTMIIELDEADCTSPFTYIDA